MTYITSPHATPRLTPDDFRELMACWCTGVAVVTSTAGGQPVGCTVSALTSVSAEPPLLLVGLSAHSRTLAAIREHRRFGVNLLPPDQVATARRFSRGDPADRFTDLDYRSTEGVPVLSDVVVAAVCVTERLLPVADHMLVVAAPVWWRRFTRGRPLVCYDRTYWALWSTAAIGAT